MLVLMLGMVLVLVVGMMMPVMMPLTMIVGKPMSSSIMRITIMGAADDRRRICRPSVFRS